MVFSNSIFLIRFLPAVLLFYFAAPRMLRNAILFVASLIFYAWGEPVYVVLMIFSTVVDYTHGMLVDSNLKKGNRARAKYFVIESMVINLALLGFFKYADFLIGNVNALFGSEIPLLHLALPIGISFYTFQTMSYTVDVYRGQAKVQRNIISFGAYVALFPQLIAGPIVQYKTVAEELDTRRENCDLFASGVMKFMCGFGKKVLLANNIGMLWDTVSAMSPGETSVLAAWLGITAYCFQVYFDFSGYSDMAIGLGRMFGFHFLENFNYPFMSKSITEFWRRWHISLGSWFREYVYIPLGGNRVGLPKQVRNIAVVWLLTGIWHGANWNYVLWGVYFGIFLVIEKFFLAKYLKRLPKVVSHIYTLLIVWVSFVFFGLEDLSRAGEFIRSMFVPGRAGFVDVQALYLLRNYAVVLVILAFGATDLPKRVADWLLVGVSKKPAVDADTKKEQTVAGSVAVKKIRTEPAEGGKMPVSHGRLIFATAARMAYLVLVFVIAMAYVVDATYNPFLYFRF
ncbi:MAG: MBOAT family protein [Lachnospiraceae bacterium]|nr:MBOAT family protein [Lachnospiraceae bacterium]